MVVADLNGDGAKQVADEFGGLAIADVGKEEEINELVQQCEQELGPLKYFSTTQQLQPEETPSIHPLKSGKSNGRST